MKFVESIVAVKCCIAFVAGPVVTCPAPAPARAAIWEFVMLKEASTLARMRQANKTDLSAMAMSTLSKIASLSA